MTSSAFSSFSSLKACDLVSCQKLSNFRKFCIICNKLRTSIKRFYAEREKGLLCNGNRNVFYKYVHSWLGRTHSRPQLRLNGVEHIDSHAVSAFCAKFCSNLAPPNSNECHSTDLLTDIDYFQ